MRIKDHEIDLLNTLEQTMEKCEKCVKKDTWQTSDNLVHFSPYWTPLSKIVVISDFCGYINEKFWETSKKYNYRREEIANIGITNCNISNEVCSNNCLENIRKFVKLIDPEILIGMGPYTIKYYGSGHMENGSSITVPIDWDLYNYKIVFGRNKWGYFNKVFDVVDSILRRR